MSTQQIVDLYDSGLTMPQVAARLQISLAGASVRYRRARPPHPPEPRTGRWQQVLLAALEHQDAVSVRTAVHVYLRRVPTRAELHAGRRAAHSLAAQQLVQLQHVLGGDVDGSAARLVLVIARPNVTISQDRIGRLSAAAVSAGQPLLTAPESQARTVQRLTRAAQETGRLGRLVDVNTLHPDAAGALYEEMKAVQADLTGWSASCAAAPAPARKATARSTLTQPINRTHVLFKAIVGR